ncbi:MAG: STAS/SEC14 domain-containing protein [Rhodospirillales bacterium]|jgi:universal stress protein A|nr:STAS/SEC14 domain-containing protein [Rhodospirillales bacterium]MDP6773253.1 STAS/SEC14 domain-containing protein [Rhodospirillales bacterium]
MFELLAQNAANVIGIKATGRLSDADYREFMPRLEAIIDEFGPLRLLVDLEGFEGWDLRAAWDDLAFGVKHWGDFKRLALVGDRAWEEMAARAMDRLMPAQVRYFDLSERDAAWEWIAA